MLGMSKNDIIETIMRECSKESPHHEYVWSDRGLEHDRVALKIAASVAEVITQNNQNIYEQLSKAGIKIA